MRNFALSAFLLVGLLAPATTARAAAPAALKTVAVVAIEAYDDLMNDLKFVGDLTQNPALPAQADGMLKLMTGGQGVKGLDTKRPWGVVVSSDGNNFDGVAFVPVLNLKQLLKSLGPLVGDAKDKGDVIEVRKDNRTVYVKEVNGWAFLGQNPASLAKVPNDPAALVATLVKTYDIAVQINVQNIPLALREMIINQFQRRAQSMVKRDGDDSDEEFAEKKKQAKEQIDQFAKAINSTDLFTVGWGLDGQNATSLLDFQVLPVAGSDLSKSLGGMSSVTSTVGGFLQSAAALAFNAPHTMSPDEQARANRQLDSAKKMFSKKIETSSEIDDDEDKALAKELLGDLVDVVKKNVAAGKVDVGGTVVLEETLSAAVGTWVADTASVDKMLKKIAAALEKDASALHFKLDAEQIKDIHVHTISIPVKDSDAANVLGSDLLLAVGIGPKNVYLTIGAQGLATLKGALSNPPAASSAKLLPLQVSAALTPILKFAAAKGAPNTGKLAEIAQKNAGKDHVIVKLLPDNGGATLRIALEEGVLRVIGAAKNVADDDDDDK